MEPIFDYLKKVRQTKIEIKTPLITVYQEDKLSKAVGLLAATKVHRVFVVESDSSFKLKSVISVTDILSYITSK